MLGTNINSAVLSFTGTFRLVDHQFHMCALLPVNFECMHTLHGVYLYKTAQKVHICVKESLDNQPENLCTFYPGTTAPDDDEEEDLSDIEEGDDADATSAKQLSKKHQVSRFNCTPP